MYRLSDPAAVAAAAVTKDAFRRTRVQRSTALWTLAMINRPSSRMRSGDLYSNETERSTTAAAIDVTHNKRPYHRHSDDGKLV